MKLTAKNIICELKKLSDPKQAIKAQGYFKTGKGEYSEGDRFLGLRMPQIRALSKQSIELTLQENEVLLQSNWHEARMLALLILVEQYQQSNKSAQQSLYRFYLANTPRINNWDLVDCSAHLIVGPYLEQRSHRPLIKLAESSVLWERRIAMMSTLHFIRQESFATTLLLAEKLLDDQEDLIHKISGWMLREVGRRDKECLCTFLDAHVLQMPRTMLRYAIEHFPAEQRKDYLKRR